MTYSEKLRSPLWQKKRLQILERDGWTCQCCHSKDKPLNVHHLVYSKCDPWEYPDYVFQTLCEDCHEERQAITDKIVGALRLAMKNVPTVRLESVAQKLCEAASFEFEV